MDQKQFEATLHDAEVRLRRLKALYDQWLQGNERLEPTIARNELDELLQRLRREHVRNTALRFRLQQVHQRYTMFNTYWRRIARQIEEGTYQRDVLRARKLRAERARETGRPEAAYDVEIEVDLDSALDAAALAAQDAATAADRSVVSKRPEGVTTREDLTMDLPLSAAPAPLAAALFASQPAVSRPPPVPPVAPRPPVAARTISPFALPLSAAVNPSLRAAALMTPGTAKPAVPAQGAKPPAPPGSRPAATSEPAAGANAHMGLSDSDVQRIYAKYVAARKSNAERTDNVRIDTIEKSLRGMLPQLEKKHAGKRIDFEVVVKDGKVALKPVAK